MECEKIIADVHTHSEFSSDAEQSVELMAKTAVEKGLSVLGISDHYDYNIFPDLNFPDNFECDIEAKEKETLRVKQLYRDRIIIQNGIELGIDAKSAKRCKEIAEEYSFDYIIGSQHVIGGKDPYPAEYWQNRDVKGEIAHYFEDILSSLEAFSDFDIFGHFDYPLRYPPAVKEGKIAPDELLEDKKIKSLCDEALCVLAKGGKALEINTGGMRSALSRTNPSVKILKRFFELGGRFVTFGSDAHVPEHIGYGFCEFRKMLLSLGKDAYTVYENRTPREIKL